MASIDAVIDRSKAGGSSRAPQENDDDLSDVDLDALNIKEDSEGWNDVEDDVEELRVKCLFCDDISPSVTAVAHHCKSAHDFDLISLRKRLGG
jgi:hypothetical protein